MEIYQAAHLHVQNANLIIIFLHSAFDSRTPKEQRAIQLGQQSAARSAGLAGNVVAVWLDPFGPMKFIVPQQHHPFFQNATYDQLVMEINRTLSVG